MSRKLKPKNVLHVPPFKHSLLSVKVMDRKELQTLFSQGTCKMSSNDKTLMIGSLVDSLYVLDSVPKKSSCEIVEI